MDMMRFIFNRDPISRAGRHVILTTVSSEFGRTRFFHLQLNLSLCDYCEICIDQLAKIRLHVRELSESCYEFHVSINRR